MTNKPERISDKMYMQTVIDWIDLPNMRTQSANKCKTKNMQQERWPKIWVMQSLRIYPNRYTMKPTQKANAQSKQLWVISAKNHPKTEILKVKTQTRNRHVAHWKIVPLKMDTSNKLISNEFSNNSNSSSNLFKILSSNLFSHTQIGFKLLTKYQVSHQLKQLWRHKPVDQQTITIDFA